MAVRNVNTKRIQSTDLVNLIKQAGRDIGWTTETDSGYSFETARVYLFKPPFLGVIPQRAVVVTSVFDKDEWCAVRYGLTRYCFANAAEVEKFARSLEGYIGNFAVKHEYN